MILPFQEDHIKDIAIAQQLAWQRAFRGILSNQQLNNLKLEDFIGSWQQIFLKSERTNLVYIQDKIAVGYVSYGPPYSNSEKARMELYGIYVHPNYWKQNIGRQLMDAALLRIKQVPEVMEVILWVMAENRSARKFYEQMGYFDSKETRISKRYADTFEEVKYAININQLKCLDK